ncbi:hypothetical protein BIV57_05865 [Mangrovactinospora gilvigrisea]|uniref:Solute-binding protein family 5 domain-containing protein n=1 Tax=Mangrovactinospora gilvigrisea TaxID=1428644 RepID=A0A1J7BIF5_9ACTN|nr:hypothetical protein BIV57_05865 [Mangrovactinospora gilvigrisea]
MAALAGTGALAVALSGCGGSATGSGDSKPLALATMDAVTSIDPAGAYDRASDTLFTNVYQSLMAIPPNTATPQPEAAKSCGFQGTLKYVCTLRSGLSFSNGDKLTAADVVFSFDRMRRINSPNGPAATLSALKSTTAQGDSQVTFTLKQPDATFPQKIATISGYIVDRKVFPADKLITSAKDAIGSGPYTLDSFSKRKAVLNPNTGYKGGHKPENDGVEIHYFTADQNVAMNAQFKAKKLDAIVSGLTPGDLAGYRTLDNQGKLQLISGAGSEIRYLVFSEKVKPFDKVQVRQAFANVVNTASLTEKVFGRTTQPLYSLIPQGVAGHLTPFYDDYPAPDTSKAADLLKSANIKAPVPVDLWYTPTHYGPTSKQEMQIIAAQLNKSGLFDATVHSAEWDTYAPKALTGKYPVYAMGWFADYPDPDTYTVPFFGGGQVIQNGYHNSQLDKTLVPATQRQPDRVKAAALYAQIQKTTAQDVPELPLWQGNQNAVAQNDIKGLEWTLDSTSMLRLWGLSRGIS